MPKFLTFDLGTTLYKVALFDDQGRILAVHQVTPPVKHPRPGWSEVDLEDFRRVLIEAIGKLRFVAGKDWDDIVACSFATQANSFTLLDERGHTLVPLILWSDRRAEELDAEMRALSNLGAMSGLPRLSVQLAIAKYIWLQQHEPATISDARTFCFISDYLTRWLTGRAATEAAVAGLSGLAHILTLEWFVPTARRLNISPQSLSPIVRAGTDIGPILPEVADQLELPRSCRFVVGTLDQYAGAIGTGTISTGDVCETTGTVLSAVRLDIGLHQMGRSPDVYHGPSFEMPYFFQMCFSSTSANLLEWYRNSLPERPTFESLSNLAAKADGSVTIEPYRDGESIEACFRNVQPGHSVGQVVHGIMECVAGALKRQVSSLSEQMPPTIRCAGGAARSDVWLQIKADTLGTTMEAVDCPEPTSLGAAMLAARTVGLGTLPELAERWVKVRAAFKPSQ